MDPGQHGLVISVGTRDVLAARRLAAASSRRCVEVSQISAVREAIPRDAAHVVLVGAPRHFQLTALTSLARHSDVPFGIISGETRTDTDRQIDATLARSGVLARATCVDAIHHNAFLIDAHRRQSRVYWRWGAGVRGMFKKPWSLAVLCAHGSANHVNLERAVLCGLNAHDREFAPGAGGCWRHGNRRFCKRGRAGQPVVYLSDVRADIVALLTCCGFAINRELFPSTASLARAAIAGGSTAFLTTMTLFVPQPWEAQYVTESLASGMDVGFVTRILNAFHHQRYGVRPYVTFGDPASRFEGGATRASDWDSFFPPAADAHARDHAIAVAGGTPMPRVKHDLIHQLRKQVRDVRERVDLSVPMLAAWALEAHEHAPRSAAIRRALDRLADAHRRLHGAVLDAWTWCEHVRLGAAWSAADVSGRVRTIAGLVKRCDRLAVAFLKLTVFPLAIEEGFTSGLNLIARRDGGACERCGCTLMAEDWGLGRHARYTRQDCPTCGFRWIGPTDVGAPVARLSRFLRRGATVSLRLEDVEGGPTSAPPRFWIVMKTKLGSRVFFTREGLVEGSRVTATIPPRVLPADTHVAAWVVCAGLRVWYGRMLCVSRGSGLARARRHEERQK